MAELVSSFYKTTGDDSQLLGQSRLAKGDESLLFIASHNDQDHEDAVDNEEYDL